MGLEGAGDGPAGLGLEDGRLDLDEPLGLELLAQGGDDGDAGVEDLLGGGVGDEVELAVAGPDVGVGDGLVGAEGVQRLGEDPQLGDLDAELAPAGGDDLALGPDPVADVEGLEHGGGLGDELVVLEEELHVAALVVEGGEAEEALGPDRRQAAGDADGLAGVGVGGEVGVGGVELAGGGGAVERVGVDVDAGGGEGVDLGQALGPLGGVAVAGGAGGVVVGGAGAAVVSSVGASSDAPVPFSPSPAMHAPDGRPGLQRLARRTSCADDRRTAPTSRSLNDD